jgi:hypothetical protein
MQCSSAVFDEASVVFLKKAFALRISMSKKLDMGHPVSRRLKLVEEGIDEACRVEGEDVFHFFTYAGVEDGQA